MIKARKSMERTSLQSHSNLGRQRESTALELATHYRHDDVINILAETGTAV